METCCSTAMPWRTSTSRAAYSIRKLPGCCNWEQCGLPLPHLLIMPFIVSMQMWQNGAGGSIPSMAGFVFGVLGIFRLMRGDLEPQRASGHGGDGRGLGRSVGLRRESESDLLCNRRRWESRCIWHSSYGPSCISQNLYGGSANALTKCGLCLAAACLTRYDGWFLAAALVAGAVFVVFRPRQLTDDLASRSVVPSSRPALVKFVLLAASAPVLWLAYNAIVYQNPLEFANGPYSAKSIEQKTATVNPAKGNLLAAGSYFLKAAELDVAEANWQGRLWLALALLGSLAAAVRRTWTRRVAALGSSAVLRFIHRIWQRADFCARRGGHFHNTTCAMGCSFCRRLRCLCRSGLLALSNPRRSSRASKPSWNRWTDAVTFLAILLLVVASYGVIWRADPICYREATINMRGRVALDRQLADWIESLATGFHVADVPGRARRARWSKPVFRCGESSTKAIIACGSGLSDPEGLWERALADPAQYADYLVGFDGDPVWSAAENHHLTALVEIHTTGQPPAAIFQGRVQARREEQYAVISRLTQELAGERPSQ